MIYDNIIIGAGPAGIQLAYFFKTNNINYLILEKESLCASFFDKYPHSSNLISINKRFTSSTNENFNLRHDWNSLLNNEKLLFSNYSKDFYPKNYDLVRYMNDFANLNELNIQFNTTVTKISKDINSDSNSTNYIIDTNNGIYTCTKLIMATGLSIPNRPSYESKQYIKHYADFPKGYFTDENNLNKYENTKVALIGSGNSSYELGNVLNNYCSHIHIIGGTKDLSTVSHYTGDIRSIYLPIFDTFFLKSLNVITRNPSLSIMKIKIVQNNNIDSPNYLKYALKNPQNNDVYESESILYYDEIIYCTGWKYNNELFNFEVPLTDNNKFPKITNNYESISNTNLYFIGSLMHSLDYKKSSGGFIHGFRYLIKLFLNLNYKIPFEINRFKFDGTLNCYSQLTDHILTRINTASSIYQMYNVLVDIFYFDNNEIIYYNDITLNKAIEMNLSIFNVLKLNYGKNTEYDLRHISDFKERDPIFLHPEINIYTNNILQDTIIFKDDLTADFSSKFYIEKIKRSLKSCKLII